MTENVDLNKYKQFVDGCTSQPSKNLIAFMERSETLNGDLSVPRLVTAGLGLSGEVGEFNEYVKKIMFHGKEYTEENQIAMKKELGDIIWYWTQACLAMNVDPNEIIAANVAKLQARYPGGKFSVYHSENRAEGDV